MSKVITLVSTKGSVGKTALAIHIGGLSRLSRQKSLLHRRRFATVIEQMV